MTELTEEQLKKLAQNMMIRTREDILLFLHHRHNRRIETPAEQEKEISNLYAVNVPKMCDFLAQHKLVPHITSIVTPDKASRMLQVYISIAYTNRTWQDLSADTIIKHVIEPVMLNK